MHIFQRCGFTIVLLCSIVMYPLHRSELLVCVLFAVLNVVIKRWLYCMVGWPNRSGDSETVALRGTFGASHRKPVVGMVTEVLRTIIALGTKPWLLHMRAVPV